MVKVSTINEKTNNDSNMTRTTRTIQESLKKWIVTVVAAVETTETGSEIVVGAANEIVVIVAEESKSLRWIIKL